MWAETLRAWGKLYLETGWGHWSILSQLRKLQSKSKARKRTISPDQGIQQLDSLSPGNLLGGVPICSFVCSPCIESRSYVSLEREKRPKRTQCFLCECWRSMSWLNSIELLPNVEASGTHKMCCKSRLPTGLKGLVWNVKCSIVIMYGLHVEMLLLWMYLVKENILQLMSPVSFFFC